MSKIYVVGMGPGRESMMTGDAISALEHADVIVGYPVYLELLGERFAGKEFMSTPMKQETERCRMCYHEALLGRNVAMVCSGDAGVYGMASLMLEIREELLKTDKAAYAKEYTEDEDVCISGERIENIDITIIPGITAAVSGAAVLGAPLSHDFCVISLSDLLTPWELIERRLRAAADGDFALAIYNPSSRKRYDYLQRACDIMLETVEPERVCGYVRNIGRDGEDCRICTLTELRDTEVDMFTTVFVGNSQTRNIDGKMVTPRGYRK